MPEYRDHLRAAHEHAKQCRDACHRALSLLDDEPLGGPGDDDVGPVSVGSNVRPNPQGK